LKHGLNWKKDNSDNPELSEYLVQAVNELGWSNPNATLKRAVFICNELKAERQLKWMAEERVRWRNTVVWIDGKLNSNLFPVTTFKKLRELNVSTSGDSFEGHTVGHVTDATINEIISASQSEMNRMQFESNLPKTTQVWDDTPSGKPNYI
jgi:hypothetical protein